MSDIITERESKKIREYCFSNPAKSCAIAQLIIDTCQVVSVATYADLRNKHRNTILQQRERMIGIVIEDRKYISVNQ